MWSGWEPWVDVVGVTLALLWACRWALRQEGRRAGHTHEEGCRGDRWCPACHEQEVGW